MRLFTLQCLISMVFLVSGRPTFDDRRLSAFAARQVRTIDYGGGPGPAEPPHNVGNAATPTQNVSSILSSSATTTSRLVRATRRKLLRRSLGRRGYDAAFYPLGFTDVEKMLEEFEDAEPNSWD